MATKQCDRENIKTGGAVKKPLGGSLVPKLTARPVLNDLGNRLVRQESLATNKTKLAQIKVKKPAVKCDREEVEELEQIEDPDKDCQNDPQMVTEYVQDIFKYLREMEVKLPIRKNYLEGRELTPKIRATVVDWLVDVHDTFNLALETLYITIGIMDRFLQDYKHITKSTIQLVGVGSLCIASKLEDIYSPCIEDYIDICDNAYSKRQIFAMERRILKQLNFMLGRPIALRFLRRFNKIAMATSEHHALGKYLLELALVDYNSVHVQPSILGAAACCLAKAILDEQTCPSTEWNRTLEHFSTYKYADLKPTIKHFAQLLNNVENSQFKAVFNKYSKPKFHKISISDKLKGRTVKRLVSETPTFRK